MSRWLICAGLAAAIVLSRGTAQAEPTYCPVIKLDDGANIQLDEVTYEGRDGPKAYFAFWGASDPFRLALAARFDASGQSAAVPNRLRMTVFLDPISRFEEKVSDLDLVLELEGTRPWRGKLPPANPPMLGSAADAFIEANDRPDLMTGFMKARTASLSVVTKSGKVLETASFNLPSQADWRGLSDGVASTLARAKSDQPCRLPEMHVRADGAEVFIHQPPPPIRQLSPPHP